MRRFLTAAAVLGLMAGTAGQSRAGQIINSTGLASPALTITFSEHVFASGTSITNQYQDLGVTFSPNLYYAPQTGGFPHIDNQNLGNFSPSISPFTIQFTHDLTSAAFAMATNPGTSTFKALENGVVVDSFSTTTDVSNTNNFYGFTGETFNAIQVTVGGLSMAMLLDNLQLGTQAIATPEPSTIALAASCLPVGLAVWMRRRRRVAVG
jgi:hypothetical protein